MAAVGPLLATATIADGTAGADGELTNITWAISADFDGGMPAQPEPRRLALPHLPPNPDAGSNAAASRDSTLGLWYVLRVGGTEVHRAFAPWGPGGSIGVPTAASPGYGATSLFTAAQGTALEVRWQGTASASANDALRVHKPVAAAAVPANTTIEVRLAQAVNSLASGRNPATSLGADVAVSATLPTAATADGAAIDNTWTNRQLVNYGQIGAAAGQFRTPPLPPVFGTIGLWVRAFAGDTEIDRVLMPWGPSALAGDPEETGAPGSVGVAILHLPAPVAVWWQITSTGTHIELRGLGAALPANATVRLTHAHVGSSVATGRIIARSLPGRDIWSLVAPYQGNIVTTDGIGSVVSVNIPFMPRIENILGVWAIMTDGQAEVARAFLPWGPGLLDEPAAARAAGEANWGLQAVFRTLPGHPGVIALLSWLPDDTASAGATRVMLSYSGRFPGGLYLTLREALSSGDDVVPGTDPGAPTLAPSASGARPVIAPPALPLAGFSLALESPDQVRLESRYTGQITVLDRTAPIWRGSAQWKVQTLADARLLADFAARLSGQRRLVRLILPPDLYGPRGTGVAPAAGGPTAPTNVTTVLTGGFLAVNGDMDYTPAPRDFLTINGRLYQIADVRTGQTRFKRLSCLPAALPPPYTGDEPPMEFARPYLLARAVEAEPITEATDGFQVRVAGFEWVENPQVG